MTSPATPEDRPVPTGGRAEHAMPAGTHAAVPDALLDVDDVTLRFGGVVALDSVSLRASSAGEILGLIGPNGAGKTTCFNAMTGVYKPTLGQIRFDGQVADRAKKHQITRLGIARTFQNIRLFPEMTALENVMVGADAHHKTSVLGALFRVPRLWREERQGRDHGAGTARLRRDRRACQPGRAQPAVRRAAPSRNRPRARHRARSCSASTSRPPDSTRRRRSTLLELIRRIRDNGVTVLLIEHDMRLVMGVCDRHRGAGVRQEDRRGPTGRGSRGSEGHQRVLGGAGRCCLR